MSISDSDNLSIGFLANIFQPSISMDLYHWHKLMSKIWKESTNPISVNYSVMFMSGHHLKPYKMPNQTHEMNYSLLVIESTWLPKVKFRSTLEKFIPEKKGCFFTMFTVVGHIACVMIIPHVFIKWLHCEHCKLCVFNSFTISFSFCILLCA